MLPIMPLRRRYWAVCEHCQSGHRLSREHGRLIAPWARLNLQYVEGRISKEDYAIFMRSIQSLIPEDRTQGISRIPEPQSRRARKPAEYYVNPS